MSERQDIFDFDDIDVFDQPLPADSCRSPERQSPPKRSQQLMKKQQQFQSVNSNNSNSNIKPSSKELQPQQQNQQKLQIQKSKKVINRFSLTDQQKINISKRLPKGFVLLKKGDPIENLTPFKGDIQYMPIKKPPKIASQQLLQKFPLAVLSTMNPKKDMQKKVQKPGLRLSSGQLPEGKSKQSQKVKGVLMKFRKHPRYPQLAQQLNKLGLLQGFTEIQSEIKKNIHTIDSFKDRCLYILNQAKLATPSQSTTQVINQLIDEFMFQIEQAKKLQFENNLLFIQKNIDKITREITDIRQSGNWYLRKKKRTQKSFDEKEVMYIADLVRTLPPAYLVGVWEIIQQRPFLQSQQKQIQINFSQLKTKKVREIQSYVKRKHNTYLTSRERKREKLRRKLEFQQSKSGGNVEDKNDEQIKKEEEESFMAKVEQGQLKYEAQQKQDKVMIEKQKSITQEKQQQNMYPINDELQSFLSVEDIYKSQQKIVTTKKEKQNISPQGMGIFGTNNLSDDDGFLELDDMLMMPQQQQLNEEDSHKHHVINGGQDVKVPPTPRFSSLDNNPNIDQESLSVGGMKRQRLRMNEQSIEQEKQVEQFEMQEPDLRVPQRMDNDSSDSSFITDDEDSDY